MACFFGAGAGRKFDQIVKRVNEEVAAETLTVGQANTVGPGEAIGGLGTQGGEDMSFAHPDFAHQGDYPTATVRQVGQSLAQQIHFGVAAKEEDLMPGSLTRLEFRLDTEWGKYRNGLRFSLDGDFAEISYLEISAPLRAYGGFHQNLIITGVLHQPGREIDRIAHCGVVVSHRRTNRPGKNSTGGQANALHRDETQIQTRLL